MRSAYLPLIIAVRGSFAYGQAAKNTLTPERGRFDVFDEIAAECPNPHLRVILASKRLLAEPPGHRRKVWKQGPRDGNP